MRRPQRLPSGRYKVRFRFPGAKNESSETFDTLKAAEQFAAWYDLLGAQGALDQLYAGTQAATVPTLDEVAAAHIEHRTGITDGTRDEYTALWARSWHPLIGALPANLATRDAVAKAVNTLGARYSAKSLQNQRGLLAAVLDRAVEHGHLTRNPIKGMRLPRGREHIRADMAILTPESYGELEARIPDRWRPLVRFLAGTGARWGEAVVLLTGDVNGREVRIRRALKWARSGPRQPGPTKTRRSNRTVRMPSEVAADLEALCRGKGPTELVFTAPRGGMVRHSNFRDRVWLPATAGMVPRPTIHDLRHSHASWLLGQGVPIHVVQARLGHESITTTVDTYSHLMPDAQMIAAQAAELAFAPSLRSLEG